MRRPVLALLTAVIVMGVIVAASAARDRPFGTATLNAAKFAPIRPSDAGSTGNTGAGGQFSKSQIENFRCTSSGVPTATVDMSCNSTTYGQDWAPDNEIAVVVDPANPNHVLAGSNDYFYRFNNSTGARQAIVPTGFFTSFDGGANWLDGQIPMRSGNGAGDPSPGFVTDPRSPSANSPVALMAQLENTGGQGGPFVTQGDVSVSRSLDGGITWSEPITVMKGKGASIGPANRAIFYDKEWLTCDNWASSPFRGRCYVTSTLFLNALHGSYASSDIVISWSDDGGATWTPPKSIAARHPSCTFQSDSDAATSGICDENQFSIPEVAPNGTLLIHFANGQNEAAWDVPFDFDSQIMVVRSRDGGATFDSFGPNQTAQQVAQLEDGLSDMPWSVIGRQTVWGHQIRWASYGNITVDPTTPGHFTVTFSDRGTPNPNAQADPDCVFDAPGDAPTYDPCRAGPGSDTNVYRSDSFNYGQTWTGRAPLDTTAGKHQWFPWADYRPNGTLAVAWDEDVQTSGTTYPPPPANDDFVHVLWTSNGGKQPLAPTTGTIGTERVDVSVTHWAGQYVPESAWPRVCGPVGYTDPPVTDATGKDCNEFHGDYTGLSTDSLGRVHVVWTGLNRFETSPQIDFYTGLPHDGFAQDAMYARRP